MKANGVENAGVQFAGVYGAAGRTRRVQAAGSIVWKANEWRQKIFIEELSSKLVAWAYVLKSFSDLTSQLETDQLRIQKR